MGCGTWSMDVYDRVTTSKVRSGTAFSYTADARRSGIYKAHEDLEVLKNGKPVTRESRDSDEHPESTPIVIGFDETGSMGSNPAILQKSLKGLFGMLVRRDVVSDPQIAIGAYGDTECDRVPVQLSQFESDNRIDDNLDNVFIEGCGGGNGGEMSTALAWFVAHHVVTDAWEKRGKRGYLFLIGDERALPVSRAESSIYLGEAEAREITPEQAFAAASERWGTYFLLVDTTSARYQHSQSQYEELLGADHVIRLETTESAPAVIASVIGLAESTVEAGSLVTDLAEAGFSEGIAVAAAHATKALARADAGGTVTGAGTAAKGVAKVDDGYGDLAL